jgi:hypothetical protein
MRRSNMPTHGLGVTPGILKPVITLRITILLAADIASIKVPQSAVTPKEPALMGAWIWWAMPMNG